MEEIDADEEWGAVGLIPEEKLWMRSSKTQEDLDEEMIGPPEKPRFEGGVLLESPDSMRRYASTEKLNKRQERVHRKGRGIPTGEIFHGAFSVRSEKANLSPE